MLTQQRELLQSLRVCLQLSQSLRLIVGTYLSIVGNICHSEMVISCEACAAISASWWQERPDALFLGF